MVSPCNNAVLTEWPRCGKKPALQKCFFAKEATKYLSLQGENRLLDDPCKQKVIKLLPTDCLSFGHLGCQADLEGKIAQY